MQRATPKHFYVKLLMEYGANPTIRNCAGRDILDILNSKLHSCDSITFAHHPYEGDSPDERSCDPCKVPFYDLHSNFELFKFLFNYYVARSLADHANRVDHIHSTLDPVLVRPVISLITSYECGNRPVDKERVEALLHKFKNEFDKLFAHAYKKSDTEVIKLLEYQYPSLKAKEQTQKSPE